jgi:hypothetical protein
MQELEQRELELGESFLKKLELRPYSIHQC